MKTIILALILIAAPLLGAYEFLGFKLNGTLEENVNRLDKAGIRILETKDSSYWETHTIIADNVPNKLGKEFIDTSKNTKFNRDYYSAPRGKYGRGGYVTYTFYKNKLKRVEIKTKRSNEIDSYHLMMDFGKALEKKIGSVLYNDPYARLKLNVGEFPYAATKASITKSFNDDKNNYGYVHASIYSDMGDSVYLKIDIEDRAYEKIVSEKRKEEEKKKIENINL